MVAQSPSHLAVPLEGIKFGLAVFVLAISNFLVVLDTTIANVSVPHIAGGLAVSPNEGTYVITSYAVSEAITVALAGWLSLRFGTVRIFTYSLIFFGIFSALCGLSFSLDLLVTSRVLQGLAGGSLMPLSQTLLLRIAPPSKRGVVLTLWSMTTLIAPIMGPIVGGYICDNWGWPFIFYINVPLTFMCGALAWFLMKDFEYPRVQERIDFFGFFLLVVWVSALQIMLDEGKTLDWFSSWEIRILCVVAIVGFLCFLIWEMTEKNPIVNLSVFQYRGYSISIVTMCLAFGAFFSSVVLTPLWLQTYMSYTATWSGYTTAMTGMLAVLVAPFAASLSTKTDPRKLICGGLLWIGAVVLYRSFGTTDMTYSQIALPLLIQGIGTPFFFVPLLGLALGSVPPKDVASAAGFFSFTRTISAAFATSIVTTSWDNQAAYFHAELANVIPPQIPDVSGGALDSFQGRVLLDNLVQAQSIMLSTNRIFMTVAFIFILAGCVIWFVPKPKGRADTSSAH